MRGSNRVLTVVVVISVALNLLLVGMMLGRIAGPGAETGRMDPIGGMRRLLSNLPEERAEVLAPFYRAYFTAMRPGFREIRGTQSDLREAMLTEPLDEDAVRAAMADFRQNLFDSQASAHIAFVNLVAELTLAERQQLVAAMNKRPPRDRRSGGRPPGEPPRPGRAPGAEPFHQLPPDPPPR